jgi:hypothetical protein
MFTKNNNKYNNKYNKNKNSKTKKRGKRRKLSKIEKQKNIEIIRNEILNGSPWANLMSSETSDANEYAEIVSAIDDFNYATEREQTFKSERELQDHLDKNITLLRDSLDKYIKKRSKNIHKAMVKQ